MPQELTEEIAYFEEHKAELLRAHAGRFALVKGSELAGIFGSQEEGYVAGLQRFGVVPFLVKQILEREPVGFMPMITLVPRADL